MVTGVDGKVRSCPCCGGDTLRVGVMDAHHHGVECLACGLTMAVALPDFWPEDLRAMPASQALFVLRDRTAAEAVKRWNRRCVL